MKKKLQLSFSMKERPVKVFIKIKPKVFNSFKLLCVIENKKYAEKIEELVIEEIKRKNTQLTINCLLEEVKEIGKELIE